MDRYVPIPDVPFSFSFLSVPGAGAADLRTELSHLDVPWTPDVAFICASSNNLDSLTIDLAGAEFEALLKLACSRFSKVRIYLKQPVCLCTCAFLFGF